MSKYRCGCCGRTLKQDQWVYSRFTGSRYCLPGQCRGERKRGPRGPLDRVSMELARGQSFAPNHVMPAG